MAETSPDGGEPYYSQLMAHIEPVDKLINPFVRYKILIIDQDVRLI